MTLLLSNAVTLGGLVYVTAIPKALLYLQTVALSYNPSGPAVQLDPHYLSLALVVTCALTAAAIIYRDPAILRNFQGYSSIDGSVAGLTSDDETFKPNTSTTPKPVYTQPTPQNADSFNMFNPANLPPRLSEYANMVYSACEDLGNFFGFQDSSVRNQAEHLLILLSNNRRYMNSHILPPALQPPSPIHALHAKVFSNYMKWCRYQVRRRLCSHGIMFSNLYLFSCLTYFKGISPNFSKMSPTSLGGMTAPPNVASRVVDLVLFFCVWGEACNIRHMPECLWFLYHKMMEEYALGGDSQRSLYAGHYLDFVVTPIVNILSAVSSSA